MDARLQLLETLYRFDLDEVAHLELIKHTAASSWRQQGPIIATSARRDQNGDWVYPRAIVARDPTGVYNTKYEAIKAGRLDNEMMMLMAHTPPEYGYPFHGELGRNPAIEEARNIGLANSFGFYAGTGEGGLISLIVFAHKAQTSATEHAHWLPLSAHLTASWRIRNRLTAGAKLADLADMAIRPDGHVRSDSKMTARSVRERLRDMVARREASRSGASPLWPELINGRWTLIDHYEASGQRVVLAVRNNALGQQLCRLTEREASVVAAARRGHSNKAIAIDLDVTESSISRTLRSVASKLASGHVGLLMAQLGDDVQYRNVLDDDSVVACVAKSRSPGDDLSPSERAIVAAALSGLSNRQIATMRGRSERTVVNQLARAFEKLGIRSRRELQRKLIGI